MPKWTLLLLLALAPLARAGEPPLAPKDRVVLLGNALLEHERFHGFLECRLGRHVEGTTFRNLGWSGDTVHGNARSSGYKNPEGMPRLLKEAFEANPTVLVIGYGMNESFAGDDGLPAFRAGLGKLLDSLAPLKARVILLSPTWHEDLGRPYPDPTEHNRQLEAYAAAVEKIADDRKARFVDLFHALADAKRADPTRTLTSNGILLNEDGYWLAARAIEKQLRLPQNPWRFEFDATEAKGAIRFRATAALLPVPRAPRDEQPTVKVKGLPAGNHVLKIDGAKVLTASAEDFAKGVHVGAGPFALQAEAVRKAIVVRNDLFYRGWRPFNDHSRHWDFMAKDFVMYREQVARQDQAINDLRRAKTYVFEITVEEKSR